MVAGGGGLGGGRGGDSEVGEGRQDLDACQSPLFPWRSSKRVCHTSHGRVVTPGNSASASHDAHSDLDFSH